MRLDPSTLTKYVDKMPIPSLLKPKNKNNCETYYEVTMEEFFAKLHSELPPTKLWGYNGMYPGPTIQVKKKENVKIKWMSNLPCEPFLPTDCSVHGACGNPQVKNVVHVHGGATPPDSDGYPDAWFTKDFEFVGQLFDKEVYTYPNLQNATLLWYHDHAIGTTRLNVYAGLAGAYIIRDYYESRLNIPKGKYEIPLIIQDKSFNDDGSLYYPRNLLEPDIFIHKMASDMPMDDPCMHYNCHCMCPDLTDPEDISIIPEFFGDTIVVNGVVWPYLEVYPRKYRFRVLNGSNARFFNFSFDNNMSFIQIGVDQGFLKCPVEINTLLLAPGERADIIVDFSKYIGQNIILTNNANTPYPDGNPVDENTGVIMQFKVKQKNTCEDVSDIPCHLKTYNKPKEKDAIRTRSITLNEDMDECGRLQLRLDNKMWSNKVSETPRLGDTEIWEFINVTPDTHPMHLHLVHFYILNYQPFKFDEEGNIVFTGPPVLPPANEDGPKDIVKCPPATNPGDDGVITRIIATFEPFSGLYVFHCHILEHEDNEMMRPYRVLPIEKNEQCDECDDYY